MTSKESSKSSLAACTILVVNHAGAQSNKQPLPRWSILRRNVSLTRSPVRLLIPSRGIQQPSGPSHAATQSNKPPILPAVYIYYTSSVIHTETRLGKRVSYEIHLLPPSHVAHADAPAVEDVPAQHRHASVDRHEAVRVAVLHQLPSAAKRHAHMLHLSSTPHFDTHSSSVMHTETRLGKRASHAARQICISHLPGRRYKMSVQCSE